MTPHHPTIGSLLRSLRARNDWTLREMSERSGIPVSTLSKVEHDRLTLSYDKLLSLSQRLNIRMSEMFAETEANADTSVMARRSIGRIEDAVRVTTPDYDYYYLCPELRRKRMIPVLARVRAKTPEEFGDLVQHSGEEFIHVLEGAVEVHTEYYDPVLLKAGESVYLDSNMGHAYTVAEGCDEVLLLGICSSSDEQLLESLMNLRSEEAVVPQSSTLRLSVPVEDAARATPIDKRRGNRQRSKPAGSGTSVGK
jgi:transcriptional regulator with XRE-family HTH domain